MRWGERLEYVAETGPGDFIFVPPYVPHQEINAEAEGRDEADRGAPWKTREAEEFGSSHVGRTVAVKAGTDGVGHRIHPGARGIAPVPSATP